MIINNNDYNIPNVVVTENVSIGDNTIGTEREYEKLRAIVKNSGMFMGKMKLAGTDISGTMICNLADSGIEMYTISNYGNQLKIILGYLTVVSGNANLNILVKSLV